MSDAIPTSTMESPLTASPSRMVVWDARPNFPGDYQVGFFMFGTGNSNQDEKKESLAFIVGG